MKLILSSILVLIITVLFLVLDTDAEKEKQIELSIIEKYKHLSIEYVIKEEERKKQVAIAKRKILNKKQLAMLNNFSEKLNNSSIPELYKEYSKLNIIIKSNKNKRYLYEIKRKIDIRFHIAQTETLKEFNSDVKFYSTSLLFKRFDELNKIIVSKKNRNFLSRINKKIIVKQRKEFIASRKEYVALINKIYSEKYIEVKLAGRNKNIIIMNWYYFASKEKRHLYLDKLEPELSKLNFKKIVFDNSINHKRVSYLITKK